MEPPAVTSVVPQIEHRAELHQYLTSTILGGFIPVFYLSIHILIFMGMDQLVHSSTLLLKETYRVFYFATPTLHNSDLSDSHEYRKKQVWGERIIKW